MYWLLPLLQRKLALFIQKVFVTIIARFIIKAGLIIEVIIINSVEYFVFIMEFDSLIVFECWAACCFEKPLQSFEKLNVFMKSVARFDFLFQRFIKGNGTAGQFVVAKQVVILVADIVGLNLELCFIDQVLYSGLFIVIKELSYLVAFMLVTKELSYLVAFMLVRRVMVVTEHYFTCRYEFVINLAESFAAINDFAMDKDWVVNVPYFTPMVPFTIRIAGLGYRFAR